MANSPITLEALQVLDAIESKGSFAAAAEHLNKVPSALSYIVQKLEEQLSVTLFVRQGRRSVLTPAGRHLLEEGRKVLGAVNRIAEQTQTLSHGWEPKIRIAFDSIFDTSELYPILNQFLEEHPNVEIDVSEEVMNGGWEALLEDKVDLLVGAPEPVPNQQGLRAKKVARLDQILVAGKGHVLSRAKQLIDKSELQQHRTVVVHDSAKQAVAWSSNIIEQSRHFFVTSIEEKIKAISAGVGIGFLPKERIINQLTNGELVALKVDNSFVVDLYIAWKLVNRGKGLKRLIALLEQLPI